ncbi:sensor histidine kinase [Paenibacillus eucommiae]|uniref:histidine kinase n=1 Tax=Paenibacillus eucommiae TaxID=1355755 RepID=A0ABS4IP57_9BACL|nr:ATP-binding protein [Paenibacillus eucommiae]MBP1989352.1 two-component system sensor histidine kinase BaeS [Paenibacillus eucommiae]
MSVNRKLFIAMASFIVAVSLVFILITHVVVRESLGVITEMSKGEDIDGLSRDFVRYYIENGQSWEGIAKFEPSIDSAEKDLFVSYVITSKARKVLAAGGSAEEKLIMNLGIERSLQMDAATIGYLHYYDPEVANLSKLRIGIPTSVTFLLSTSLIVFIPVALLVAYWISRRFTAPLRQLVPAIDRIGNGEYGTQVQISSKDEYGKVAAAVNSMSSQLQHAEEIRRNLVADVSHELRTPLTVIQGKLDFLQQDGRLIAPEELLTLQDELIRFTRLVDDLHQLSLAEARKLTFEYKQTDVLALMKRTVDRALPGAQDKDIEIVLECEAPDSIIPVDPNRMSQVFLNLLVNAVRYTAFGGSINILLKDERDPSAKASSEKNMLCISITDNGSGIAPEHLPFLFNRFYRTDEARTRNSGGMGLGLAIAQEFILIHNGTIQVESNLGIGTTFTVRLPY